MMTEKEEMQLLEELIHLVIMSDINNKFTVLRYLYHRYESTRLIAEGK